MKPVVVKSIITKTTFWRHGTMGTFHLVSFLATWYHGDVSSDLFFGDRDRLIQMTLEPSPVAIYVAWHSHGDV